MSETTPSIIDTTTATFEKDVMERSQVVPVVVDFWAPWCDPCRQLTPLLEKLLQESEGRFLLAKLNIDENPDLAAAFAVQSIPFVVAFRDRRPVNQFFGILPEDGLREWLATFLPSPAEELLQQGKSLETEDPAAAEAVYRQALELAPDDPNVKTHLARMLLAQERVDECRAIIDALAERGFLEPEAEKIQSQLELRLSAEEAGDLDALRQSVQDAPDDLSLQLKLVDSLAVSGHHEEALDLCLAIIQRDRLGAGADAKATMLKIFDMIGSDSELAGTYRRKLATALY